MRERTADNLLKTLVALVLLLVPASDADAYPIFYRCDKDRRLQDVLTPAELVPFLEELAGKTPASQKRAISAFCSGLKDCESQLKQIANLSAVMDTTEQAASLILAEDAQEMSKEAAENQPSTPLASGDFALRKALAAGLALNSCRKSMLLPSTPSFESLGNIAENGIAAYYPYHTPYMFVIGAQKLDPSDPSWNEPDFGELDRSLGRAMAMGADPYVALSLGLMEEGTLDGSANLHLDPSGAVGTIGCPERRSQKAQANLESFDTFYSIEPRIIRNPALSKRVRSVFQMDGAATGKGRTYACVASGYSDAKRDDSGIYADMDWSDAEDVIGESGLRLRQKAPPEECCLELDFSVDKLSDNLEDNLKSLNQALAFENIRILQTTPYPGHADPAYRLQKYNGYSHLMGEAESVPAFRSGIDFFQTPTYGYQSMDFILNSLLSNPLIRESVEAKRKALHADVPSILCEDVKVPGTYAVESAYYFEKHRDAPRLKSIWAEYNSGVSWNGLTSGEKKIMLDEFRAIGWNGDPSPLFSRYFSGEYANRDTVSKASSGYSWQPLTDAQWEEVFAKRMRALQPQARERYHAIYPQP